MVSQSVIISSSGIRRIRKYNWVQAIAEYIWNGFDACATKVEVDFNEDLNSSELGSFTKITINDDGYGIPYGELGYKFGKVFESLKRSIKTDKNSLVKGKNGYGRFTFYAFARYAKWKTTYKKAQIFFEYEISISRESLQTFSTTEEKESKYRTSSTRVEFSEIDSCVSKESITKELIPYLKSEFAWFLKVCPEKSLVINGVELDTNGMVADVSDESISLKDKQGEEYIFPFTYIEWKEKLKSEASRIYMLNNNLELKFSRTTRLNNKGDNFWHSIIVISDFFDNMDIDITEEEEEDDSKRHLFSETNHYVLYRELINKINQFLSDKRRPFLKKHAQQLIAAYESDNVFPKFGKNSWDIIRYDELKGIVAGLYEVQPKIFIGLNNDQKRIFLELINQMMDYSQRSSLFKIIESIIDLSAYEREEFAQILKDTRLSSIISTIKLLHDRLIVLSNLKQIVFNHDWKAGEVKNLQVLIENHYWIFGEEYRFICAEEVKFHEALCAYRNKVFKDDNDYDVNHPSAKREMDLFLSGRDFPNDNPRNLIVEIKNPTSVKKLTNKQTDQIEDYVDVVLKTDMFNSANEEWEFVLIGNEYDSKVARKIQDVHTGLYFEGERYKLYVRTWSDIINSAEKRIRFLLERLQIERSSIAPKETLDDAMNTIEMMDTLN